MFKLTLVALSVFGAAELSLAQEATPVEGIVQPAQEQNKETYDLLKKFYRHEAKLYEFTLDEAGKLKLTLQPTVMTWTGDDYKDSHVTIAPIPGEVYIWTYEGRAVVVGGVASFPRATGRLVFHEFHVLTELAPREMPIRSATKLAWRPVGVTPKPAPDAPTPAPTAPRRLAQMRRMAQEFRGGTRKPDGSGEARLRLVPAPIYRLDADVLKTGKHKIVDGAVFVFTGEVGTDSEMVLYFECRQTDEGLQWTYVPAAMTYLEMWMEHKEKRVWHLPNFHVDPGEHHYFSSMVEGPLTLDEVRSRVEK
jgi:hypothetical protein